MGLNLSIAPKDYFIIDGVDSRDFGVYLFQKNTLASPTRVYERISVPGRNGDVLIDDGKLENATIEYGAVILDKPYDHIVSLKNFLLARAGAYCRLEDTFDMDEYYMAHIASGIDPVTPTDSDKIICELTFDRKPQRYLKHGEDRHTFTAPSSFDTTYATIGALENPTYNLSSPKIWVRGKGTVIVGDYSFEILQNMSGQDTVIDCEEEEAVYGDDIASANKFVKLHYGRFPRLKPGTNTIQISSGITRVRIEPRWWRI